MPDDNTKNKTLEQVVRKAPNPTGKGGLGDHPENINYGGRPKNQQSVTAWYHVFLDMPLNDFLKWDRANPNAPMAATLAYAGVAASRKELNDRKEVTDRTDGKPKQYIDIEADVRTTDLTNKDLADTVRGIIEDGDDENDTQENGGNTSVNQEQVQEEK